MKETSRRRIAVTSSFNEISRINWERGWWGGAVNPPVPFKQQTSRQKFKDDVILERRFLYLRYLLHDHNLQCVESCSFITV